MRQYVILFLALLVLCSCNSFEDEAKDQMEKTMKELAKNPDTYQISNIKTLFVCDSLCILQFTTHGQNSFGGWNSSRLEYAYYYTSEEDGSRKYHEFLTDLDEKSSPYEKSVEMYNSIAEKIKSGEWEKMGLWDDLNPTSISLRHAAEEGFPINDMEKVKAFVIYHEIRIWGIFRSRVVDHK